MGDGETIALAREDISAGDEPLEWNGVATLKGKPMTLKHGFGRFGVESRDPIASGVFVHDEDIAIGIATTEQDDGVMMETVVESGEPFDSSVIGEVVDDMNFTAEIGEELAGGDVPVTIAPGAPLPACEGVESIAITGIGKRIVADGSGDEARGALGAGLERDDVIGTVPGMADAAGIGGGVDARTPGTSVRPDPGTATAGDDVAVLSGSEGGGLLDADDVVFEAEISIDIFFTLEMAHDDPGIIWEGEHAAGSGVVVGNTTKEFASKVFEVFAVGFAYLAEQETFEPGKALTIVETELGEEPEGLTAAACAAEADGSWAVGMVTEPGGSAGGELAGLKQDPGANEIVGLFKRTAGEPGCFGKTFGKSHGVH